MEHLTEAGLAGQLDLELASAALHGTSVSVLVADAATGRPIYARDPDRRLTPASNTKLYTTAFALDTLGADYRFTTALLAQAAVERDGTLIADLVLRGSGDPMLDRAGLAELARRLARAGVRRVAGGVLADASAFPAEPFAPGWTRDGHDLPGNAPPNALACEQNCARLQLWPGGATGAPVRWALDPGEGIVSVESHAVTAPAGTGDTVEVVRPPAVNHLVVTGRLALDAPPLDVRRNVAAPDLWTAALAAQALAQEGVAVDGPVGRLTLESSEPLRRLAEIQSPPLHEIISWTNKPSDNFIAEQLYRAAGAVAPLPATPPERQVRVPGTANRTESRAEAAMQGYLCRTGIVAGPGQVRLADGSGLSRYNLVSAATTVALLLARGQRPDWPAWHASLPVAGVDGSLARRMRGTPAQGALVGKTGTLRGVSCLAGYVGPAAAPALVYAIMVNGFVGDNAPIRTVQDRIGAALAAHALERAGSGAGS